MKHSGSHPEHGSVDLSLEPPPMEWESVQSRVASGAQYKFNMLCLYEAYVGIQGH